MKHRRERREKRERREAEARGDFREVYPPARRDLIVSRRVPVGRPVKPTRAEVRRMRPEEVCKARGCGTVARWQVELTFFQPIELGADLPGVPALSTIGLCDEHRAQLRMGDILTFPFRQAIAEDFAGNGLAPPDFRRTNVRFVPIPVKVLKADGRPN